MTGDLCTVTRYADRISTSFGLEAPATGRARPRPGSDDRVVIAPLSHIAAPLRGPAPTRLAKGGLAPRQVQRAKDVLMAHLDGRISLEDLARECGVSRSHFARAFKRTTGVPPHRWLMERRLERARELLARSKLTMAEIATACGFADQSHFTRCFSASTGVVPSQWRRLQCC